MELAPSSESGSANNRVDDLPLQQQQQQRGQFINRPSSSSHNQQSVLVQQLGQKIKSQAIRLQFLEELRQLSDSKLEEAGYKLPITPES